MSSAERSPVVPVTAPIDPRRLASRLQGCRIGCEVAVHDRVASTNGLAREAGRAGGPDGAVVVAEAQSAGRGRRGREWESPRGKGIYTSVLLRPSRVGADYASAVQLGAGIAVAETLAEFLPEPPELLWPNDCVCRGQKIAGILVEAETSGAKIEFLVCGIGINVDQRGEDFSPQLRGAAASIAMLGTAGADRSALLAALFHRLESWDDRARADGLAPIIARWLELAPSARDHGVEVDTVGGLLSGTSAGLSPAGGLRVRNEDGVHEVLTGELVRVRRRR